MANGKVSEFLKSNWRSLLLCASCFVGIFCGIWACSKSASVDIDARRNVITITKSSHKGK